MPHMGARSSGGATEDERVHTMQGELARMLGEHVERHVEPPRRETSARVRRLGSHGAAPPVSLDPAVIDAITLAVDQSIERLLPGLVEDAIGRVLPDAVDTAISEIVESSDLSGPSGDRASGRLRILRKAWGP